MTKEPTVNEEGPNIHPLYRDPVHGWMCLRHGGCEPALILRRDETDHPVDAPPEVEREKIG